MRHGAKAKPTIIAFMVIAASMVWSSLAAAAYDFELVIERYAAVDTVWAVSIDLPGIAINTGTEADTLDLVLTFDKPALWVVAICVEGKCTGPAGEAYAAPGDTVDFYVSVQPWADPPGMASMVLTVSYRHAPGVNQSEPMAAFAGLPSILLVDDDLGAGWQTYLETAVENAGHKAHVYDADTYGRPGVARLSSYWATLWTTADGSADYVTSGDEQDMMTYLDRSGNLFLTSMGFLTSRGTPTTFITDYLHIDSWTDDVADTAMTGVLGDPVSDGMNLELGFFVFPPAGIDTFSSDLELSYEIFTDQGQGPTGIRVEEDIHKIVFTSFPFECVSVSDPDPDNQTTLIERIIAWFDPPPAGIDADGAVDGNLTLMQNSPNPFAGSTRISFAVPGGSGQVDLKVYDVQGRVVRTLLTGHAQAGQNSIVWDGVDDAGRPVASGIYFYRLNADHNSMLRKMVLLK